MCLWFKHIQGFKHFSQHKCSKPLQNSPGAIRISPTLFQLWVGPDLRANDLFFKINCFIDAPRTSYLLWYGYITHIHQSYIVIEETVCLRINCFESGSSFLDFQWPIACKCGLCLTQFSVCKDSRSLLRIRVAQSIPLGKMLFSNDEWTTLMFRHELVRCSVQMTFTCLTPRTPDHFCH